MILKWKKKKSIKMKWKSQIMVKMNDDIGIGGGVDVESHLVL